MDDEKHTASGPQAATPESTDPQNLDPEAIGDDGGENNNEPTQHDLILKTVFHHFFGDLLELVKPEFAARVDLNHIEFLEQETFSDFPKGTHRRSDLVAKLQSNDGEERLVLVQAEVEADFRSSMDERCFYYYLYLRGKYRLPVLVLVVFLRGGEKQEKLAVRKFVDFAEGVEVCRFRYPALYLARKRTEDFVDRPQPLAPALASMMKSDWDPVEKKLRCLHAIRHADIDDARRFLLVKMVDIYIELDQAEAACYAAEVAKEENKEVQKMVITWEEALAARETRGEARGLHAMRNSIAQVLERRLESVPAFVREKLDGIRSIERLEAIFDQALSIHTVDELIFEPER